MISQWHGMDFCVEHINPALGACCGHPIPAIGLWSVLLGMPVSSLGDSHGSIWGHNKTPFGKQ